MIARITADDDLDLGRHDPAETFGWHKREAKRRFVDVRDEVAELQKVLFAERTRALLVVLQAMDAGGKDGVLRDVLTGINPAGVQRDLVPGAERGRARPRPAAAGARPHPGQGPDRRVQPQRTTRTCWWCA